MVKNSIKFITPFLLLCNFSIGYSASKDISDNNNNHINEYVPGFDVQTTKQFNNVCNEINTAIITANNNITQFIGMIFDSDKLENIVWSADLEVLIQINNTLKTKYVKEYIITHSIGSKSIQTQVAEYKKTIVESDYDFEYNDQMSESENKKQFNQIYCSHMTTLFRMLDKQLNQLKRAAIDCKSILNNSQDNDINRIKKEILDNVLYCLEQNQLYNTQLLETTKQEYEDVFAQLITKVPLHKLLSINENFFSSILHKIQNTTGNEQLANIHKFWQTLNKTLTFLPNTSDNKQLQIINQILDLNAVQKYLSGDCFYFETGFAFEQDIRLKYNRSVSIEDFENFENFTKKQIQNYMDKCNAQNDYLQFIANKTNNVQCIKIIKKLLYYFDELKSYLDALTWDKQNYSIITYFTKKFVPENQDK